MRFIEFLKGFQYYPRKMFHPSKLTALLWIILLILFYVIAYLILGFFCGSSKLCISTIMSITVFDLIAKSPIQVIISLFFAYVLASYFKELIEHYKNYKTKGGN